MRKKDYNVNWSKNTYRDDNGRKITAITGHNIRTGETKRIVIRHKYY